MTETANTRYVIYLVIAVLSLHLLALPLGFCVSVYVDSDRNAFEFKTLFYFLPIFIFKSPLDRLIKKAENEEPSKGDGDNEKSGKKSGIKSFLIKVGMEILGRVRVRDLILDAEIGTGDAAATACSVGSAGIAYSQACAYFGVERDCVIIPNYDESVLFVRFSGIFSLCLGDIIYAVLASILSNFARHGKKRRVYGNGTYASKN